ncbi:sigma-70 family RNA polymerase sigma factor [Candidatus Poribacteria bacterium]|nr:sigma-70 family RNA polymerase sigma factor [Candidatus Poribacteria bacterium]
MIEEDVQLIHRILSGDDAAFTVLVRKYQKSVHALAWRKIGDFHYAEEVTQDIFLQVYNKLSTLKDPRQFAGWLYVMTSRHCSNWRRDNKPRLQLLETMAMDAVDKSAYARYISEQREAESAEKRQKLVKKLIDKLPESERTVMTLYYLGEMTTREISRFLGVSVHTITSRLQRARRRLQQDETLLIQEMLGSFQLSTDLSESITQKIADMKPIASPPTKSAIPWLAVGVAAVLVMLMLGLSNKYLMRFQRPYSFEAASEPTIEIIDTDIILDIVSKPAVRNQAGRTETARKSSSAGLQISESDARRNASEESLRLSETQWMPDPALREAVREKFGIPADAPLTQAYLQEHLTSLDVREKGIVDLTGLEHATDLQALVLIENKIHDISPLSGLMKLGFLDLGGNQISDLRPLATLTRLETLHIWRNEIEDISPLTGLVNLERLLIQNNDIKDFSPLDALRHLAVVNIKGNFRVGDYISRIAVAPRIKDRDYPSIFAAWSGNHILNLPNVSDDEAVIHHDLFWGGPGFHLQWHRTPEGFRLFGRIDDAHWKREYLLSQNPNFLRLVSLDYTDANPENYPEDWPYWIRDENGNRVRASAGDSDFLIDFTHPIAQDILVQKAVAVAKCGLYDGIFLGGWEEGQGTLDSDNGVYYRSVEAEGSARISMVRRIREDVGDDFLIIVKTNQRPAPLSAPYVNGMFMEAILDEQDIGYTHAGLREIESTLLWSEQNFREPQITALEGRDISLEPADSPRNQQRMRVITTLSLTHSDGYVCYNIGIKGFIHEHEYEIWSGHEREHIAGKSHHHNHQHYWYPFWDAPLGRPVGKKAQLYHNSKGHGVEGLFIREFTNGWAVYNRSGKAQDIRLPEQASGVASGIIGVNHTLSDLDGEIYLK